MNIRLQQLNEKVQIARTAYQQHMAVVPKNLRRDFEPWVAKSSALHSALWQAEIQLARETLLQQEREHERRG